VISSWRGSRINLNYDNPPSRARVRATKKVNDSPVPFLRDPPVSERPHSSAGSAVNAPLIFAGSVSIKEPEPRNSRRNAVTVPVTPPCPNYFISLLRAYILYLYPSNPWAHLALGWVAFPEATHGRRRCGIPAAPDISPNFCCRPRPSWLSADLRGAVGQRHIK
jgi:hypothetical protein